MSPGTGAPQRGAPNTREKKAFRPWPSMLHATITKRSHVPMEYRYPNVLKVDAVFRACCVLHNQILHRNGHDVIGEGDDDWIRAGTEVDDERMSLVRGRDDFMLFGSQTLYTDPGDETNDSEFNMGLGYNM